MILLPPSDDPSVELLFSWTRIIRLDLSLYRFNESYACFRSTRKAKTSTVYLRSKQRAHAKQKRCRHCIIANRTKKVNAFTEKEPFPGRVSDDVVGRRVQHFHDAGQLLDLVLARKDGIARVQFGQDATCEKKQQQQKKTVKAVGQ